MPDFLYKYRRVEGKDLEFLERMLLGGEIYFADPATFNDPFDLAIDPSYDAPPEVQEDYWYGDLLDNNPQLTKEQCRIAAAEVVGRAARPGAIEKLLGSHRATVQRQSVFCACANPTSTLMWAYYAEGHQGVAVRLNLDVEAIPLMSPLQLWPVDYTPEKPQPNFYTADLNTYLQAVFSTKSHEWQHEREWRFLRERPPAVVALPLRMIDGVVFGLRTTDKTKATIREWARRRAEPFELGQIVQQSGTFNLLIEPAGA